MPCVWNWRFAQEADFFNCEETAPARPGASENGRVALLRDQICHGRAKVRPPLPTPPPEVASSPLPSLNPRPSRELIRSEFSFTFQGVSDIILRHLEILFLGIGIKDIRSSLEPETGCRTEPTDSLVNRSGVLGESDWSTERIAEAGLQDGRVK